MIVSIGKSFLFGIVFDAEALPEEERAAGRAHPGFPLVRSAAVPA
jgi:hypothetical protein